MEKGMLVVISGPSGSGKGTVVKEIFPREGFLLSVSATTRKRRENETDGKEYFFVSKEKFGAMIENNELLEHAQYIDNCYGTPRAYVEEQIANGITVFLEIETCGALQIKEKFPDAVLVFLTTPDLGELRRRLTTRNSEDSEEIEKRLQKAEKELKDINKYDYLIINEDVKRAADEIRSIISAELLRCGRSAERIKRLQ